MTSSSGALATTLDVIPSVVETFKSLAIHDVHGVTAGVFSLFRVALTSDECQSFRAAVEPLARKGWKVADDARRPGDAEGIAHLDEDVCVAYVLSCLDADVPPTSADLAAKITSAQKPEDLPRWMRSTFSSDQAISDDEWTNRLRALPRWRDLGAATQAAAVYLDAMLGAMFAEPAFVVQFRLWKMIASESALAKQLDQVLDRVRQNETDLADLKDRVAALEAAQAQVAAWGGTWDQAAARFLTPAADMVRTWTPLPPPDNAFSALLSYRSGMVDFHGREPELNALTRFCETPSTKALLWQAITGPGGTGKSRLAWELRLRMEAKGWGVMVLDRSRFDPGAPALPDNWALPYDVLLIVDYVAFHAREIGSWLSRVLQVSGVRNKIRVLFLERTEWAIDGRQPMWYENLKATCSVLDDHRGTLDGANPVLALSRRHIDPDEQKAMLVSIDIDGKTIGPDVAAAMVERLTADREHGGIDPEQHRPLYLLFLASAYLDNPDDSAWRTWDLDDLHEIIYEREIRRIEGMVPERHNLAADLWAFSTATGRPIDNVITHAPACLRTEVRKITGETLTWRDCVRSVCSADDNDVTPYDPDIPGEYLVLARLAKRYRGDDKGLHRFVQNAWKESPVGFVEFLSRACVDFAAPHRNANLLDPTALLIEPKDPAAAFGLAAALAMITSRGAGGAEVHARVAALVDGHQDDEIVSSFCAGA
ncbi:MAG: ATP-binding protein, partial [Propionibacteriaceae bacterium]|nr:ATP-binding protein [Propionibacteriaceae bacterium]